VRRQARLSAARREHFFFFGGDTSRRTHHEASVWRTYDSTVKGVVKLDGNVVPRGTVSFTPHGRGLAACGLIQCDGAYQLHTGREEGLPPGQYTITVAANELPTTQGKDGGPPPVGKAITPAWYRNPTTSGLTFDMTPGDNEFNLELTLKPPAGWKSPTGRR
jgi:hypothetical protein